MSRRTIIFFPAMVFALAAHSSLTAIGDTVTINFNEYAFPTSTTSYANGDTVSYNLLDDSNVTILASDNGDANDFFVTFYTASGPLAAPSRPRMQWQTTSSGRYTAENGYQGAPSNNNPGTNISAGLKIEFGSQFTVTNISAVFTSLNTAGIAWEASIIGLLQPDGSFFSTQPTIDPYLTHTVINGNAGLGWFVADSKSTTNNVGNTPTASGTSGSNDNKTLTYTDFGLASGTQIGGIFWLTQLQDVRGTTNGNTSFTASLSELTIDIVVAVPEPTGVAGLLSVLAIGLVRYRRRGA